jgi:hypothetical protein
MLVHLVWQDSAFLPAIKKKWATLSAQNLFDGASAYKFEFQALCAILGAAAAVWLSRAIWKYMRAWWVGLASLTTLSSAIFMIKVLRFGPLTSKSTLGLSLLLISLLVCELWRFQSVSSFSTPGRPLPPLVIPSKKRGFHGQDSWRFSSSDDPIHEWGQDIIGRTAVVEVLAEHIFVHRTPIVALNGELGDGKSSVLNLLRRVLEGHAVVVSFSAWLPGSEETLALDLFRDIATECKQSLYIPQLKKISTAYARTLSGSVSFLAGLRELMPTTSQRDEIGEIRNALGRVPVPIVVLLDEVDRMEREELLVLLKILRGAASIPNVTFICAFSEIEVRQRLSIGAELSNDYLDKFFPVSVHLAPPDPDMVGKLFQGQVASTAKSENWFLGGNSKTFHESLEQMWQESLSNICTNLRKAGLLLNDLMAAVRPIVGEVNTLDLIGIETLRRFEPAIYRLLRKNGATLTYGAQEWTKGQFISDERRMEEGKGFLERLEENVSQSADPVAIRGILELLFPVYAKRDGKLSRFRFLRPTGSEIAETEKRICAPEYFSIYFRASVPEEMYSEGELARTIARLNQAKTEMERVQIFREELHQIPAKHPKRDDFLWKIGRSVSAVQLIDDATEGVAYAAATCATDYVYDLMNIGEAARALNVVFAAAQVFSSTPKAQSILVGAMTRTTDDTFAMRLLEFTENRDRNKILTKFDYIDPKIVRATFIARMIDRYGMNADPTRASITQCDWRAFQTWVLNSPQDKETEREFWRRFIGSSRRKLAQALNFLFPVGFSWSEDPRPLIDNLLPLIEAQLFIENLKADGQLDELESSGIKRFEEMLNGKWLNLRGG